MLETKKGTETLLEACEDISLKGYYDKYKQLINVLKTNT